MSRVNVTDYLAEQLRDMAPHRAILRAVECEFMSKVPLTPPVLDIGCGDGHFASIAYTALPIDVGIDVMKRDLPEAAARPGVYREVMFASATDLPFDDASFGTVVSNCVIEHIPDNAAVLREISRVLRPGGTFATTLPSEHYPDFLLGSTTLPEGGAASDGRSVRQILQPHLLPLSRLSTGRMAPAAGSGWVAGRSSRPTTSPPPRTGGLT